MTHRVGADELPTSPETPHAKREARTTAETDDDLSVDNRYQTPTSDRDFFAQVVGYMNRSDRRFVASNRRQQMLEADVKALRREVLTYVKTSGRVTNGCLIIMTSILAMFLLMRVLGPLDLSEWRGLRVAVDLFGGTAAAEAP